MMPYPTDDDGEPDHPAAVDEMFGHSPTNANPVYVNDGAETLAVTYVDMEDGTLELAGLDVLVNPDTWESSLEDMWDEWVDGSLTFRNREFLEVQEETYDTEREVAVNRLELATLLDYVAEDVNTYGDTIEQEVRHAVDYAKEVLN